ncbi:MAG: HlyD family secretion protein, partial [Saprospiraceae bacterium]|nr:HlyD family secretion protein [Saprospiraceae bacterium]
AVDIYTHTADSTLSVPIIAVTAKEEKETNKAAAKEVSNQEKKKDEDLIKEIVFVVVGDTVAVREVKTGIQDNDHIQILKGLEAGETVVTGPYSAIARKLKSGSRISVENKDDEKGGNAKKGGISVEVD